MAKATITLKDKSKLTFESVFEGDLLDFINDYREEKHGETISKASNSRRANKARGYVRSLFLGENLVNEDGEPLNPGVFEAFDKEGNEVYIPASNISSIVLSD